MIDDYTNRLPQQHSFILAEIIYLLQSYMWLVLVCRRGERLLISLGSGRTYSR